MSVTEIDETRGVRKDARMSGEPAIKFRAQAPHQGATDVYVDFLPDHCPICRHAIDPRRMGAVLDGQESKEDLYMEVAFQCPRNVCGKLFIGRYQRKPNSGSSVLIFQELTPVTFREPTIPDEVEQVSKSFKEIYSQAAAAESYKLDQIAGMGYRKALEFLIKDYCISKNPDAADEIRSERLAACIKNRVSDAHIKECARLATWLGNDETHYVRLWEDKDITDLKTLIELTMIWIRSSVLTERYTSEMRPES